MIISKDKINFFIVNTVIHHFKDVLLFYTFIVVFLKSIIFLGLTNNSNHAIFSWSSAWYFGQSKIVYSCFIIVLLSFSLLFKGRMHMWFLIFTNLFISFLLVLDLWYYRGFGSFISMHLLKETANLDNLSDSIFSMVRTTDIVFIFDVILLIIIALFNKNPYKKMKRSVFLFVLLFIISVGYIEYYHYKVDIHEEGKWRILFRICWTPNQTISNLSPIGFHIYDSYNFFQEDGELVLKQSDKDEIKTWYSAKKENLPDNKYKSLFKGKNLIVIQVESLENFIINQKINNQEITPNLNKLIKSSLYFPDFYEQVNNGTSSDSDLMTNTSVYPVRTGSTFFRFPYNAYNSLPKLLQNNGYNTLAIHPDKGAFWNWMKALYAIGFEKCIDSSNFNIDEIIGLGLSDASFLRQVESVVKNQKQPFYTFMITLTSHGPFNIPESYRELNLDLNLDKTKLGGYFQSFHYTDKQIGAFISKLDSDGLLDNTVVAIYGDHCGVHKYYQDELASIQPTENWWMENNRHIPLIIYQKNLQGELVNVKGGQIDTMPTLAYLMGIDENEYIYTAMGRNLLKTKKDFAVLADKKFVGESSSEKEKQEEINGIDLADKIIRSNYFKSN